MTLCAVAGCDGAAYCRGWCQKHYARWQRHGDPTTLLPRQWRTDALVSRQFGTCCPTCPGGGRTVLYSVDGRGQVHRCIAPAHVGPRQHRDVETVR